jgi:hypothetical protein
MPLALGRYRGKIVWATSGQNWPWAITLFRTLHRANCALYHCIRGVIFVRENRHSSTYVESLRDSSDLDFAKT